MILFDTHFHYYGEHGPQEYIRKMHDEMLVPPQSTRGIPEKLYLMAVGADYLESCRAREFAGAVPDSRFAVGVYPHSAGKYLAEKNDFSEFRSEPNLAAIGEIGLDYYYDGASPEDQRKVLEEFLNRALEWNLPAIVHCRDLDNRWNAYDDAYRLLSEFAHAGGRFVVHCFSGSPEYAEKFLALGGYLGVTGMVTFLRAQNVRESLKHIPLDRLLLETDSPYLAPVPQRGRDNHPGFLIHVAAKVAEEKGLTLEEIARITLENGKRFFCWEEK